MIPLCPTVEIDNELQVFKLVGVVKFENWTSRVTDSVLNPNRGIPDEALRAFWSVVHSILTRELVILFCSGDEQS